MKHGKEVMEASISGGGLEASFVTPGAALRALSFRGRPMIIGLDSIDAYRDNPLYLGAMVGRFANRIAGGSFRQDENRYFLDRNEKGNHTLHGGRHGTSSQIWKICETSADEVVFVTTDRGELTGFPGDCEIEVRYSLPGEGILDITITSRCDKITPCSLAPHPYFNLGGSLNILDHEVRIFADRFLPVDGDGIPQSSPTPVQGTEFDLRQWRAMGQRKSGFDHNYCLWDRRGEMQLAAAVRCPETGISMELHTSEPGLQFYTGAGLGSPFHPHQGFCLEPQAWPDTPNRPDFPQSIAGPGNDLVQKTRIIFSGN